MEEYQNITLTVDGLNAICDAHRKVGVELLYNSVHRNFNQLKIRCGRENQHPVEQTRRTGKKRCCIHRSGVNMLQFCSVSNSLSHTTLSIKWGVYFSKDLCRSSLLCRRYDSACICIWVYNKCILQLQMTVPQDTHRVDLTLLQRCCQHILLPQMTGLEIRF